MNLEFVGFLVGYLTAIFVLLFVLSFIGYRKSSNRRAAGLCLIMGFFALKNIAITVQYLGDDMPALSALLFADVPVALVTLVFMARN